MVEDGDLGAAPSLWRRAASDTRLRHALCVAVIAVTPSRRVSGRSKLAAFHVLRPRKLSFELDSAIRANVRNRSLCDPAAEFGVRHETVRAVCRRSDPVASRGLQAVPIPTYAARRGRAR